MISIIMYNQQNWASNTFSRLGIVVFFRPSIFFLCDCLSLIWSDVRHEEWRQHGALWYLYIIPLCFSSLPRSGFGRKENLCDAMFLCACIRVFLPRRFSCGEGKRAHLLTSTIGEIVRLFSRGHCVWNKFYHCVLTGSAKIPKVKISLVLSVWLFPPVSS